MADYFVRQNYAGLRPGDRFSLADKDIDETIRRGIAGGLIVKEKVKAVKDDKDKAGSGGDKQDRGGIVRQSGESSGKENTADSETGSA